MIFLDFVLVTTGIVMSLAITIGIVALTAFGVRAAWVEWHKTENWK